MSLFRKPKRNIRRRNVDEDEENIEEVPDEAMDVECTGNGVKAPKERKSKDIKEAEGKIPSTLLSFAHEEGNFWKNPKYMKNLDQALIFV